jgi:steroid 5-alpha reductase family enzyme
MLDWTAALMALIAMLALAALAWPVSLIRKNVAIVDSLWSVFFILGVCAYVAATPNTGPRTWLVLALVALWGVRLTAHITARSIGEPEDRRYQAIRANHQPHFWLKSLFLVFFLQAFLAWVICLSALAAVSGQTPPGPLDYAGLALWAIGMTFEVVGDWQLTRFRRSEQSAGQVLDSGLWRYTRHPNYFGEAVLWWGLYLMAWSAGHGWTVFAPLLMTFLLLRVSGVSLLEKDIAERRPAYREYIRRTNAFFPGRPKALLALMVLAPLFAGADALRADDADWRFRVFLDDREIGYHHFYLNEHDNESQLRSVANFELKLLFVRLFHYEHENIETWNGNCLASIESKTNANGEPFAVAGRQESGQFRVTGKSGDVMLPACVMSFAYWNPDFLEQKRLLNTQNGEFQTVEISGPVLEKLEVQGESRPSYRYRLAAGALNLDLWYSLEKEWLALQSEVKGGRLLRYELM